LENLFYFPANSKEAIQNLSKSIFKKVDLKKYSNIIGVNDNNINSINNKKVNLWGFTDGSLKQWENITDGDNILIYSNGAYLVRGTVSYKLQSEELSMEVWGVGKEKEVWKNIIVIDNLEPIYISKEKFNKEFGYSKNFFPRGFNRVNIETLQLLKEKYGSVKNIITRLTEKADLNYQDKGKTLQKNLKNNFVYGKWAKSKIFNQLSEKLDLTDDLLSQLVFQKNVSYKTIKEFRTSNDLDLIIGQKSDEINKLKKESPEIISEVEKVRKKMTEFENEQIFDSSSQGSNDNIIPDDFLDEPDDYEKDIMLHFEKHISSSLIKVFLMRIIILLILNYQEYYNDTPTIDDKHENGYPVESVDGVNTTDNNEDIITSGELTNLPIGEYKVINNKEAKQAISDEDENEKASNE
jgi:hypothetical protein